MKIKKPKIQYNVSRSSVLDIAGANYLLLLTVLWETMY